MSETGKTSSNGVAGGSWEEEFVTYKTDPDNPNRLLPQIRTRKKSGLDFVREFESTDMNRILEYEQVLNMNRNQHGSQTVIMPDTEQILVGDYAGDDPGTAPIEFPTYHAVLRAGYLFLFHPDEVEITGGTAGGSRSSTSIVYEAPPCRCIPLDHVDVQFPPGGRRVFREHANNTAARTGYELIIQHVPPEGESSENSEEPQDNSYSEHTGSEGEEQYQQRRKQRRPHAFLVADSLSKRTKWAEAIRARSRVASSSRHPTLLRAGYSSAAAAALAKNEDPMSRSNRLDLQQQQQQLPKQQQVDASYDEERRRESSSGGDGGRMSNFNKMKSTKTSVNKNMMNKHRDSKMDQQMYGDDADLASAVAEYGQSDFDEHEFLNAFFERHNHDDDALDRLSNMEQWLLGMKKSLKGAVLEQYEYFVQASGEMTTMGKEVSGLKSRIETQVDLLKEMKDIDFLGAMDHDKGTATDKDEIMGGGLVLDDESEVASSAQNSNVHDEPFFGDDLGEMMNRHRGGGGGGDGLLPHPYNSGGMTGTTAASSSSGAQHDIDEQHQHQQIEVPDWLDDVDEEIMATIRECRYDGAIDLYLKANHEIEDLLEKHEQPTPYRLTRKKLDELRSMKKTLKQIGNRISGRLEESLRRKNEALRQAARRERTEGSTSLAPLVSPCCLNDDSLYLQLLVKLGRTQEAADAYSARRSLLLLETLQERPMSGAGTVDLVIYAAQLSQSFFSCLANSVEGFLDLFLTSSLPPTLTVNGDKSEDSDASSLHSHSIGSATKNLPAGAVSALVLWCDSELSKFAMAFGGTRILSNLALSPPKGDILNKGPRVLENNNHSNTTSPAAGAGADAAKDRKNAIEVAAQCIDQAFLYASQNLDSVGLPLTPRLAEMIRVRLKGCELEVSKLLEERWRTLTQDWRTGGAGDPTFAARY